MHHLNWMYLQALYGVMKMQKKNVNAICASYGGKWTGQWHTIVEGAMSVCECEFNW